LPLRSRGKRPLCLSAPTNFRYEAQSDRGARGEVQIAYEASIPRLCACRRPDELWHQHCGWLWPGGNLLSCFCRGNHARDGLRLAGRVQQVLRSDRDSCPQVRSKGLAVVNSQQALVILSLGRPIHRVIHMRTPWTLSTAEALIFFGLLLVLAAAGTWASAI
jgi:hypothetical protein